MILCDLSMFQDYRELDIALSSLTITQYSASEAVRLCLRKHDTDTRDSDDDESTDSEENVEEESEVVSIISSCIPKCKLQDFSQDLPWAITQVWTLAWPFHYLRDDTRIS